MVWFLPVSHRGRLLVYSCEALPHLLCSGLHVTFFPSVLTQDTFLALASMTTSFSSSHKGSCTWGCASLKHFLGPSCPGRGSGERLSLCVCKVESWRGGECRVWLPFPLPDDTLLWLGGPQLTELWIPPKGFPFDTWIQGCCVYFALGLH